MIALVIMLYGHVGACMTWHTVHVCACVCTHMQCTVRVHYLKYSYWLVVAEQGEENNLVMVAKYKLYVL